MSAVDSGGGSVVKYAVAVSFWDGKGRVRVVKVYALVDDAADRTDLVLLRVMFWEVDPGGEASVVLKASLVLVLSSGVEIGSADVVELAKTFEVDGSSTAKLLLLVEGSETVVDLAVELAQIAEADNPDVVELGSVVRIRELLGSGIDLVNADVVELPKMPIVERTNADEPDSVVRIRELLDFRTDVGAADTVEFAKMPVEESCGAAEEDSVLRTRELLIFDTEVGAAEEVELAKMAVLDASSAAELPSVVMREDDAVLVLLLPNVAAEIVPVTVTTS